MMEKNEWDPEEKVEPYFDEGGWIICPDCGTHLNPGVFNPERAQLEQERLRLAACGVAALANTELSRADRIGKDNPNWSAAYGDVCDAVDRGIALRARLAEAGTENERLKAQRKNWEEVVDGEAIVRAEKAEAENERSRARCQDCAMPQNSFVANNPAYKAMIGERDDLRAEVESLRKLVAAKDRILRAKFPYNTEVCWSVMDRHKTKKIENALALTPDSLKGKALVDEGAVKEARILLAAQLFNRPLSPVLEGAWGREASALLDKLPSVRESEAGEK